MTEYQKTFKTISDGNYFDFLYFDIIDKSINLQKYMLNIKKGPTMLKKYKAGQISENEFGEWIKSMRVKQRNKKSSKIYN